MGHKVQNYWIKLGNLSSDSVISILNIFSEYTLFFRFYRHGVDGFLKKENDMSTLVNNKLQYVKHRKEPIVLDSGKCSRENVFN